MHQWVGLTFKALLGHLTGLMLMALQAYHAIKSTVQVDDSPAAGALMQAVNVLGDQQVHVAALFQTRQRAVGFVGSGVANTRPPSHRPGQRTNTSAT